MWAGVNNAGVQVKETEWDGDEQKRSGGEAVEPGDFAALPPRVEEKDDGDEVRGDLAEHGDEVEAEGEGVVARAARLVEVDPRSQGEQERRKRERVLKLGGVADGVDEQRVDGEEEAAEPGEAQAEAGEEPPKKQGAGGVQGEVADEVPERGSPGRRRAIEATARFAPAGSNRRSCRARTRLSRGDRAGAGGGWW